MDLNFGLLLLSPDCSSQPTPPELTFHSRFLCFCSGYFGASGDGPAATWLPPQQNIFSRFSSDIFFFSLTDFRANPWQPFLPINRFNICMWALHRIDALGFSLLLELDFLHSSNKGNHNTLFLPYKFLYEHLLLRKCPVFEDVKVMYCKKNPKEIEIHFK